jgi:hypothetical protein
MYIKLKNGKNGYVLQSSSFFETQCDWCSKTIKKGKQYFLQDSWRNGTCSLAHAKSYMNSRV